jgi:Concanavalin A-like lectin/glucanases superfamily
MFKRFVCLAACVLLLSIVTSASGDLVGHWTFDEGSGNIAYDVSGNGNDGTFHGNPQWVAGVIGGALRFNGNGDYIDCGNAPIFNITQQITLAIWVNANDMGNSQHNCWMGKGDNTYAIKHQAGNYLEFFIYDGAWHSTQYATNIQSLNGEWHHMAGTFDGSELKFYLDGELAANLVYSGTIGTTTDPVTMAENSQATGRYFDGMLDDPRIYNEALSQDEIKSIMLGEAYPNAFGPDPADGAVHPDTWVTLSWRPGSFAVSHDVYLGDNFDDVNSATHESDLFRGNQVSTYYVAGFPGFAYPDGLVPGTTYYWRIDEVNDAEPNSPWKGPIWTFSIPPKKAYNPSPADGAESVAVDAKLSWTAGFGAKLHTVYFGDDFDTVANATGGLPGGGTTYDPSPLKRAKTYYWRVDEFDGTTTYTGDVWSFTTQGAVGNPNPANGAVDVKQTPVLSWTPGAYAASHEVYFGGDLDAVRNATKTSPEFKGTKALGDESYAPDKLAWETTYYWRIDEVNDANPDSPWVGRVWSFTTAGFMIIDDFEDYTDDDAAGQAIWQHWIDGFGVADNGSQVGYVLPPYAEQTIVHGGNQSMPLAYDNTAGVKFSEAALTLTNARDWTEEGVSDLSIWFRGLPGSVGSFVEGPAGTYTMTASGADIWDLGTAGNYHDEFHFAYKTLTGAGSIVARVQSVQNTNGWAKAGVMIRETLDGGSPHMFACITPSNGVAAQGRADAGAASFNANQTGVTAPHWVKLERDLAGNFTVSHSADGTTWQPVTGATPQNIQMGSTVYVGLALTAHNANATCQAVFTNVTITGTVSPQWADQDIGITSNAPEPLYVAVSNAGGQPVVVVNPDQNAATTTTWTEWVVPLSAFADQGIDLTNVDKIVLGLGTKDNATTPGGSGTMYFDDIRLYRPRTAQ